MNVVSSEVNVAVSPENCVGTCPARVNDRTDVARRAKMIFFIL